MTDAKTDIKSYHHVTLNIEGGELHPGFTCDAPEDAPCRRHPEEEKESWTAEEATVTGAECWALEWIDAVGIVDAILGYPDITLASVPVNISYEEGVSISPISDESERYELFPGINNALDKLTVRRGA